MEAKTDRLARGEDVFLLQHLIRARVLYENVAETLLKTAVGLDRLIG